MSKSDVIRAAGCVVYRVGESGPEVLLVHRSRYDDWSFPKGKVDPGETDLECACREVEEETGFTGEIGEQLKTIDYNARDDRPKAVRYWLMRQTGGTFEVNDEVDQIEWLSPAIATAKLSYTHDSELLNDHNLLRAFEQLEG